MRSQKLSDLLFGVKPPKVRFKSLKEELMRPARIGHILAVMCYDKGEYIDTLFINNIDICQSYTVFYFSKQYFETYPFETEATESCLAKVKVWYKNDTSIEIIKL